jgi:hypothetical protein
MSKNSGRPGKKLRPKSLEPFFRDCRAVVVLMEPDETEDQAWRRYLKKHPEDIHAAALIFTSAELIN